MLFTCVLHIISRRPYISYYCKFPVYRVINLYKNIYATQSFIIISYSRKCSVTERRVENTKRPVYNLQYGRPTLKK